MALTIYHNPKCSKSRKTLELLYEESKKPKIFLYTEESPTSDDIIDIAEMLNLKVEDLIMPKDIPSSQIKRIKSLDSISLAKWISINSFALQRPIVINYSTRKAVICRPPEKLYGIL